MVWLGDLYHTARINVYSTQRWDLLRGTLDFLLPTQNTAGQFSINPVMGYDPALVGGGYFLADYQILGLLAWYHYVKGSNDLEWVRVTWPKWLLNKLMPSSSSNLSELVMGCYPCLALYRSGQWWLRRVLHGCGSFERHC
jgi:hypothetical protein